MSMYDHDALISLCAEVDESVFVPEGSDSAKALAGNHSVVKLARCPGYDLWIGEEFFKADANRNAAIQFLKVGAIIDQSWHEYVKLREFMTGTGTIQ
jgi:hypothetical protein